MTDADINLNQKMRDDLNAQISGLRLQIAGNLLFQEGARRKADATITALNNEIARLARVEKAAKVVSELAPDIVPYLPDQTDALNYAATNEGMASNGQLAALRFRAGVARLDAALAEPPDPDIAKAEAGMEAMGFKRVAETPKCYCSTCEDGLSPGGHCPDCGATCPKAETKEPCATCVGYGRQCCPDCGRAT